MMEREEILQVWLHIQQFVFSYPRDDLFKKEEKEISLRCIQGGYNTSNTTSHGVMVFLFSGVDQDVGIKVGVHGIGQIWLTDNSNT